MSKREKEQALEDCMMPILLGNTRLSRKIARNIYISCGISPFVYGKLRILDVFDISSQPIRLPKTDNGRLLCESLIEFCEKYPDMLPILVPCSEEADGFIKEYSSVLESRLIITEPNILLAPSPIARLTEAIG